MKLLFNTLSKPTTFSGVTEKKFDDSYICRRFGPKYTTFSDKKGFSRLEFLTALLLRLTSGDMLLCVVG
jgi:hypothetical protein